MAKARHNKLTLKEKINLIDASRAHSQRQLAEYGEYDDQRDLSSTPKTFLDAPEWIDSIQSSVVKIDYLIPLKR